MSAVIDKASFLEDFGVILDRKLDIQIDTMLNHISSKLQPVHSELEELKRKFTYYESDSKRRNFVLYGVKESEKESFEDLSMKLLHILNDLLKCDINFQEIDNCFWLGQRRGSVCRPILVKCITQWRKEEKDLTKEQVKERRLLVSQMMELREQGRYATIKGTILITDGQDTDKESEKDIADTKKVNKFKGKVAMKKNENEMKGTTTKPREETTETSEDEKDNEKPCKKTNNYRKHQMRNNSKKKKNVPNRKRKSPKY
ncbi:hypothetical protein WDU94_015579 [Cyamophila willieti]